MPHPDEIFRRLIEAREYDPYRVLGLHPDGAAWVVRVYRPGAERVSLVTAAGDLPMTRVHAAGIFAWRGDTMPERPWRVRCGDACAYDAYAFPPEAPAQDVYLFSEGRNFQSYRLLGAQPTTRLGVTGVCFRVWAPGAERVSVVGDFNGWDGRRHPLASLGVSGIWELFVPELAPGALYKFELRARDSGAVFLRADPYARAAEQRPKTSSRVVAPSAHAWGDQAWLAARSGWDWLHAPINIYEMHPGSWMRHPDGRFYTYRELAERLVPYVVDHGFTHLEFMPLTEHPLDESWGYQTTGYFAPTSRFGTPDDLRALVDACHQAGIGVILDWVPGHFPEDDGALASFDGSALFEHADPRLGRHPDWGTRVFNYGRNEVRSFLLSSAYYWLAEFHFDGLRVDAVASMLYLDYSRRAGEWLPNHYGGRENLEAIAFLRELNVMVHAEFPGALTIAEESTAWPQVSRPTYVGGLGFSLKWNMGWMNDTLQYFHFDPVHRRYHHDLLTFGQLYAYSENFLLPLSHDEVVHGKGALPGKMPGDEWQRFANVRLLFAYQLATPGKKLNFMGNEFGQTREWRVSNELEWSLLKFGPHAGLQRMVADLNQLYRRLPALHELDAEPGGFAWIDCDDASRSVLSFVRTGRDGSQIVAVFNFTPVPRTQYRLGVPGTGRWQAIFNSDSRHYGGTDVGDLVVEAAPVRQGALPASIVVSLPPLGAVLFARPA
ncbi:MAG: 1,4-alpha-glucan branching protein GlgB [Gammaproteobacteria bacterium]|nr:1,4-alpha-glucan branching protein GlgB [Gammaproteobacteria bacterium]